MKKKPLGELKTVFCEPEGGYKPNRLSMALRMLVSEKDFIEFFTQMDSPQASQKAKESGLERAN